METGEILDLDRVNELEMEKEEIIENLGIMWKDTNAEIAAIESEEKRLGTIKESRKKLIAQIEGWINEALGGQSYKSVNGLWECKYTKSKVTEVVDMDALLAFDVTGRFIKFGKPEARKKEIKDAILKEGITVAGCAVVEKSNFSMK